MATRDQSRSPSSFTGALALRGLGALGLRLRLSRERPAAYPAIRRGNAGQLLSS
jgi:hypothetical protein